MSGLREAGRSVVVLLLSLLLAGTVNPVQAQPQSQEQANSGADLIIRRAEEAFLRGEEAWSKGLPDIARKMFDESLDTVLESGIDLRTDPKLDSYYRILIKRIHKYEAQPGDVHPPDDERVEPSLLDEVSEIKDTELAAVAVDGVKIFGKYDFEFSVAPPVFQFINFFTSGRGRSTMIIGLQRSGRYREMAEKVFKEERVPIDLIWLAQAESVWKPNALSRAAAKGIWQFIPSTGLRYGLAQTAWVDERSHPEKATRAAARYLRWLHDYFAGDWLLAMAAYNSGENRVAGAIAKCGYADFWELYRRGLLPLETRNYVPSILAIMVVSKNQRLYGLDVKPDPPLSFEHFELPGQTDLKVVADLIAVPYEVVQDLNPELRRGASPLGQRYTIKLPKGMKKQFEVAYASLPEEKRVRNVIVPVDEIAGGYRPAYRVRLTSHRVARGETLSSLAKRNKVSVQELARLNRMSTRGELRKGQTIKIPKQVRASRDRRSGVRAGKYRAKPVVRSSRGKAAKASSRSRAKSRTSPRRHR